jgi:hypothetical protein
LIIGADFVVEADLVTGAVTDLLWVAAIAGAAIMEATSNAAEIFFSMVFSYIGVDRERLGRMAGTADHVEEISEPALNRG